MQNSIKKVFTYLYIFSFFTWGVFIVLSKAGVSISYAIMGISWLLMGDFKQKWKNILAHQNFILPYLGIAFLFILGIFYSTDFKYAWDNIRVKLPMFFLPIILFSEPKINQNQFKIILLGFVLSSFLVSVIGYFKNWDLLNEASFDRRKLSPFVSHIQLSQAINISLIFIYFLIKNNQTKIKYLLVLPVIWFLFFATKAHSLTLVIGIIGIIFCFSVYFLFKYKSVISYILFSLFLLLIGLGIYQIKQVYTIVFVPKDTHVVYPLKSANGNFYESNNSNQRENGYLVGAQIQLDELYTQWQKRSAISLDSTFNGHALKHTLIRFLTSKGLSKDSLGISALSVNEIQEIEKGVANVYYIQNKGILSRIHRTFWEIQSLHHNYYESSSLSLRFIFWLNGWQIFKNNFWFGVGTGDVKNAYTNIYLHQNTYKLPPNNQLRAHNQFLTNYVTLGILGGTIFLFLWIYHFKNLWLHTNKLETLGIIWIINSAMIYEDLLETLSAIAIVSFSTIFWLYSYKFKTDITKKEV